MNTLITLDIDGTITDHHSGLSSETVEFFHSLHNQGYHLAFITGRSFDWGHQVLHALSIPYYFAIHNGAIIMEMPTRKILAKKYINSSIFPVLDEICKNEPSDYAVYGGYEADDVCYYRPQKFDSELLSYIERRVASFKENWQPQNNYDDLPINSFASVKCFGKRESAERLSSKIADQLHLHAPMIRDPFDNEYYVIQATHPEADKGEALVTLKSLIDGCEYTIAGGDDLNDIPMLQKADFAIAMETGPAEVLSIGDIIAPAASENGIIQGIKHAIEKTMNKEVT